MEKKNNKKIIWLLVFLIILVVGFTGYMVYEKIFSENKRKTNYENVNKSTTTTSPKKDQTSQSFTEEEIEKYLSYVPFENDSKVMSCAWNQETDCDSTINYLDAYSKDKVTINDIADELLLRMAIFKTKDVSSTDSFASNFDICGIDTTCELDGYYKGEEVKNKITEMYNKSVELKDFSVGGGVAYYKKGYLVTGYGAGNYPPSKINKVISYEIQDNDLIILEQAIFIYETTVKTADIEITKTTNYKNEDILKSYNYVTCSTTNSCNTISEIAEQYAKDNLNNSNKFKHTFKVNSNGTYYWYSSEIVNS